MACRSRTPIDCSLIWSHSRRSARYLIEHRAVAAPGSVPVSHHLHGRRRQRCGARSRRCAVDHGARGERGWTQYATDVRRDGEGGERRADDHGHSESGHGGRWSAAGVTVRRERRGVVRRRAHRVVELDERDAVAGHRACGRRARAGGRCRRASRRRTTSPSSSSVRCAGMRRAMARMPRRRRLGAAAEWYFAERHG